MTRILITMEGGLVQDVHCDDDHEVAIVDYDTEGTNESEREKLPGGYAMVSLWHSDNNHLQAVNWSAVFTPAERAKQKRYRADIMRRYAMYLEAEDVGDALEKTAEIDLDKADDLGTEFDGVSEVRE